MNPVKFRARFHSAISNSRSTIAAMLCLAFSHVAVPQEPLDAILDRGYVAHWLVCGPFTPDVDTGIADAVRRGAPALGTEDYMAPLGGIQRLRPQHLNEVRSTHGVAYWQRAGASSATFDLSPFFPEASEGVAYAGFYAQAENERLALVELQSNLGARVWFNGELMRDIDRAGFREGGLLRLAVTFKPGLNFLVFEVPGLRYERLAATLAVPPEILKSRYLANRPLLTGGSGFEFGFKLQAARAFGDVVHGLRLENAGPAHESGQLKSQPVSLDVVNNGQSPSQPIQLTARTPGLRTHVSDVVPPLQPGEGTRMRLEVPTVNDANTISVTVALAAGDLNSTFTATVVPAETSPQGVVHVLTGLYESKKPTLSVDETVEKHIERFANDMRMRKSEPKYGFDLGPGFRWQPLILAQSASRAALHEAFVDVRCGVHLEMGPLDERLVGDEVLARNILYGYHSAHAFFDTPGRTYFAWDIPAIAPQTPQLVAQAKGGIISNLAHGGLPPLFRHVALNGSSVWHRRKQSSPGPATVDELRVIADSQRQELQRAGLASDVLVNEGIPPLPEPFLLGGCDDLAGGTPSIRFSGQGAEELFRAADNAVVHASFDPTNQSRVLNSAKLGELISQPELKHAYAATEQLTGLAERAATAAGLLGADYPSKSLDQAWRQLIAQGRPDRLGVSSRTEDAVEMLAGLREAAALARQVLDNSLAYIAQQVDTYRDAPVRQDGVRAVVVFNPSPWTRTDRCELVVEGLESPGFSVIDDGGHTVPCEITAANQAPGTAAALHGSFAAQELPGFGWRTFYIVPGAAPVKVIQSDAMQIENEYFWVTFEPDSGGAISSVVDKATGKELSAGLWNDVVLYRDGDAHGDGDWGTPEEHDRASRHTARVSIQKHAAVQRAIIETDIEGVVYRRTIEVRPGIDRIDCLLAFSPPDSGLQTTDSWMFAITCDVDPNGRAPVVGERFGAVVARRTRGISPAYRWAAAAPGDALQAGPASAVLQPLTIVYDSPGAFMDAAKSLQSLLVQRGIPCGMAPDVPAHRDRRWTDSTEFANHHDDARASSGMRIILGGPQHNVLAKSVLMQIPKSAMSVFNERLASGVGVYIEDGYTPEDLGPVPTLILAGATPEIVARVAGEFGAALRDTGRYELSEDLFLASTPETPAEAGVGIFFPGAYVFRMQSDGTLVLALASASGEDSAVGAQVPFQYAFYPFRGRWHDSRITRAAHGFAEPFQTAVTDLHASRQPASRSLLNLQNTSAGVTAIKPGESPEAAFSRRETRLVNGLLMRVYESSGRAHTADLEMFIPMRDAYESTVTEERGESLGVDVNRVLVSLAPFAIKTVVVASTARAPQGESKSLEAAASHTQPVLVRHWRHNRWVPLSGTLPVSLVLEGSVRDASNTITVHVANNLADQPAAGAVALTAPPGWHLAPDHFDFNLPPRQAASREVVVMRKTPEAQTGGVLAYVEFEGQQVFDVLQLDTQVVEVTSTVTGGAVELLLKNRTALPAISSVEAVMPPAFWPELGPHAIAPPPRLLTDTIPPNADRLFRLEFGTTRPLPLILKVTANATVTYHPVDIR